MATGYETIKKKYLGSNVNNFINQYNELKLDRDDHYDACYNTIEIKLRSSYSPDKEELDAISKFLVEDGWPKNKFKFIESVYSRYVIITVELYLI
jgi:hypothetical protein